MFPRQLEKIFDQRLEAIIEPRMERWLHEFMTSPHGEAVISDILAETIFAWMKPGASDADNYLEKIVLQLVSRLRNQPGFREKVAQALNSDW
jgi:hypothetical protein